MKLNEREYEILLLLSNEYSVREIAEKLKLKPKIIEESLSEMSTKFKVKSELGLVKKAITQGIIKNI